MINAILSLSLLLTAAPMTADPVGAAASVKVAYRDLDLGSDAGRAELDHRLAHAVKLVCPSADPRELHRVQAIDACRVAATNSANRQRQIALASTSRAPFQVGSIAH